MNPADVGKKVKETWPTGVASDGRKYIDIPDAELGAKFILANGDKGLQSLGLSTADTSKETANLRKEFTSQTKELGFEEFRRSWNKVTGAEKTGAGDLTILYSYIKALDPTSVVREGEINISKAAESVPGNIIRAYQRAKEGKLMSNELRQEMTREIGLMYNERAKRQMELNAFYTGLARDTGLEPEKVVGGVGEINLADIPQMAPTQQPSGISGALGGLLYGVGKNIAQPFATTGKTGIAAGQTLATMGLQNVAPQLASKLSQANILGSQETIRRFSEQPQGAFQEQLGASAQLALPKFLGGAVRGIKGVVGGIVPKKGVTTELAKKAGELNASKIIEAGEKFIGHEPAAKTLWKNVKPTISSKMPATDLVEKMYDVWKGAYSKTGEVRTTAEAKLYNKLFGAGRRIIEEQAPELSKQISKLKFLHELPKQAQKGTWLALKGTAIGKMLGL